ncbi:MAG TPA: hypothetical protein VIN40_06160 [Candidatus Tyrphobacter sp.]
MTTERKRVLFERKAQKRSPTPQKDRSEWETVEIEKPALHRGVLTSFRLPSKEFLALQKAAQGCGETLSEFIRKAIALRLYGAPLRTSLDISSGTPDAQQQATFFSEPASGQTKNPATSVYDEALRPPRTANIFANE